MLDDSIMQLIQASADVPVYLRSAKGQGAINVPLDHMDCPSIGCAGTPMSRLRFYGFASFQMRRMDGCTQTLNVVFAPEDRFYGNTAQGSLARALRVGQARRHVIGGANWNRDMADLWVRLVAEPGEGWDNHINGRYNVYDYFGDDDENGDHAVDEVTIENLTYVRGGYLSPNLITHDRAEVIRASGRLNTYGAKAARGETLGFQNVYGNKVFNRTNNGLVRLTPKTKELVMS